MKYVILILITLLLLTGCTFEEEKNTKYNCQTICLKNNMSYHDLNYELNDVDIAMCYCRFIIKE